MARARNIKPGFFENEDLADCGPYAMLLFAGLWTLADREGRLEDRPRRISARLFPYFDVDVDAELGKLGEAGFIARYTVAGQAYIEIPNFAKHQSPHMKEAASTIPSPEEHQTSPVQNAENPDEIVAPDEHGTSTRQAPPDSLIADSLIADSGLSESGGAGAAPTALAKPKYSPVFEHFWREWLTGVTKGHGLKAPAYAAWKRMKLDGAGAAVVREELAAGLARWKASAYWQQEGGRFVMNADRWLRERAWDDEPPEVTPRASPGNGRHDPNAGLLRVVTPPTPEEVERTERIRREALARSGETAEERWRRLHPEIAGPAPRIQRS